MKYDPDTISKNIKKNEEIKNIFFVLIYIISVPIILFSIFLMLIELGKNNDVPEQQCKGSLNVRLGTELHTKAKMKSIEEKISINELIKNAVANYLNK